MATITNRQDFTNYCLKRLGYPVVEINVDMDQVDDRIDEAIEYFRQYHYDGIEEMLLKQRIRASTMTLTTNNADQFGLATVVTGVTSGVTFVFSNVIDSRVVSRAYAYPDINTVTNALYVPSDIPRSTLTQDDKDAHNIRINNNSLYRSCKDFINVLILPTGTFLKIWTERLYPKLDAYQALTDNSIDEASLLFTDPEHFAAVVGKSLTQKVMSRVS